MSTVFEVKLGRTKPIETKFGLTISGETRSHKDCFATDKNIHFSRVASVISWNIKGTVLWALKCMPDGSLTFRLTDESLRCCKILEPGHDAANTCHWITHYIMYLSIPTVWLTLDLLPTHRYKSLVNLIISTMVLVIYTAVITMNTCRNHFFCTYMCDLCDLAF